MPPQDESRDEALKSLDERLATMEAQNSPASRESAQRAMGRVYRFLGEVVGGMLGGLGFGWLFDRVAHTQPYGLVGGMLIGVGVSTFVAVRSAGVWAKAESERVGASPSVPDDEDD
jgi:ATP synthase protein I